MAYKVFISSKREDADIARDLAQRLEKTGVKVFTPSESIEDSEDFVTKINNDLRRADEVLVIITNNSVDSRRLAFDMGVATSLGKRVTPIVQGIQLPALPPL